MIAGMTVLPASAIVAAPAGAAISPVRPIRTITPRSTKIAAFSMPGLPSPGITRAPSNTTVCAGTGCTANAAKTAVKTRPIKAGDLRNIIYSPDQRPNQRDTSHPWLFRYMFSE